MKRWFRAMRPSFALPSNLAQSPSDKIAFWAGTGLGIGFLKPASATWGSLLGMLYLFYWSVLPDFWIRWSLQGVALCFSGWAAGRCEKMLHQKDPHPVVIDEIVALPFAFWPLLEARETRWGVWLAAFCLYRIADVIKPWPARRAERLSGGVGIVADDIISALYTGLALWLLLYLQPNSY